MVSSRAVYQWFKPERVVHYAVAMLLVTLAAYAATRLASGTPAGPNGSIVGRDYFAFYIAGQMVNTGHVDELYNLSAQQRTQDAFMAKVNPAWKSVCLYLNPPHYAYAMSWISRIGYAPSLFAWWSFSLVAFAITALYWRSWIRTDAARVAILLAVCMPAWFQAFAGGQNSFFSLLILTVFAHLLIKQRDLTAGFVLSLLAYKFQLILLPAALLLYKRRWHALLGLAAGGTLTLAFTVLVLGSDVLGDYVYLASNLGHLMQQQGFEVYKQHSWYGFFELALGHVASGGIIRAMAALAVIGTLILLTRIWRGPWQAGAVRFPIQLAALFVATIITSPHLFHYDMVLVILPAMLWLRSARDASMTELLVSTRLIVAGIFIWLAAAGALAGILHVQLTPILLSIWLILLCIRNKPIAKCATAFEMSQPNTPPAFTHYSDNKKF